MRVYKPAADVYERKLGGYGKSLSEEYGLLDALMAFLYNGNRFRGDVLRELCIQVHDILLWFERQRLFDFYGSSIIIVYEGTVEDTSPSYPMARVKLVDFAHWRDQNPKSGQNEGCVQGLKRIMESLRCIRTMCSQMSDISVDP